MVGIHSVIGQSESFPVALQRSGKLIWMLALVLVLLSGKAGAEDSVTLDRDIEKVKAEVASLSQTLFELEESILHPADTQVAVFLALKDKEGLALNSVELYLNGSPVSSHLYSDVERESLRKGGIQRLYIGNLPHGSHQLKAVVTATSANERFIRRELQHQFRKRPGESRIQMTLDANAPDYEPVVSFQEWK